MLSIRVNYQQFYTDTYFSPIVARSMERRGSDLLEKHPEASAVLYWGAMNCPIDIRRTAMPYYIITDGPYDPLDNTYPIEWKPRRWKTSYFQRQRQVYRGAEHVFTYTTWARNKLIEVHGLDPGRVTRIGWGPMHQTTEPTIDLHGKGYFLSVGNEWLRKGMDYVALAGTSLNQKYPDAKTIIIGHPHGLKIPDMPGVIQVPHSLPGPVIQTLMASARCFILGSRFDSAGHVTFEALQAGTPVIGTAVGGVAEGIQEPRGGYVVPIGDVGALSKAMEKIWTGNIEEQRKSAYQVFQESGGWRECARKIVEAMRMSIESELA
jgi:glycosyltransferase involved in cell wall biosynthesis